MHADADRRVLEELGAAPAFDVAALPGERLVVRTEGPLEDAVRLVATRLRA